MTDGADGADAQRPDAGLVAFTAAAGRWIDLVFREAMRAAGTRGGAALRERHGSGYGNVLIEYRTTLAWPNGVVTARGIAETSRYRDPATVDAELAAAAERGSIERDVDGSIRATAGGHVFLDDLYATQEAVLAAYWDGRDAFVSRLAAATLTLLDAGMVRPAMPDGAFAAMTPNWEPPGISPSVLLLNRLSAMRYHRSDAHATAWRAAGLTAAEMVSLQESATPAATTGESARARRDAIEARTNEISAAAFDSVHPADRAGFLRDLQALSAGATAN